jgi:hypothetical protein
MRAPLRFLPFAIYKFDFLIVDIIDHFRNVKARRRRRS